MSLSKQFNFLSAAPYGTLKAKLLTWFSFFLLLFYRAMQELLVHFQPEPSVPPPTPSTLSSLTTVGGQSGKGLTWSLLCNLP